MRAATLVTTLLTLAGCQTTDQQLKVQNQAPVAEAGENISQTADRPVKLEGGASFDPDGDAIAFTWAFDTVPTASSVRDDATAFPGNNSTNPTSQFNADVPGTYIVSLMVTDVKGATSALDYVVIEVIEGSAPVANAGADVSSELDAGSVSLDGSSSYDPLGRDLTYAWTFESVADASALITLDGADTSAPSFTPDVPGRYVVSLTVNNGFVDSEPDTVNVFVDGEGCRPQAGPLEDIDAEDCTAIQLDASDTYDCDPQDTLASLEFNWEIQSKPAGSAVTNADISDRAAPSPTFWADVAGTYVLSTAAYDGDGWGNVATVTITASERSFNTPPSVSAGSGQSFSGGNATCEESGYTYDCDECASMTVDLGADSTANDPDGDPLIYEWTVIDGDATISDADKLHARVKLEGAEPTEPGSCEDTTYQFQLKVTDCTGAEATSQVTYTVNCCGAADTASR